MATYIIHNPTDPHIMPHVKMPDGTIIPECVLEDPENSLKNPEIRKFVFDNYRRVHPQARQIGFFKKLFNL